MSPLEEIAKRYNAYEITDRSEFCRKARVLQSMWRSEQGYPVGKYRGRTLGSRLDMPRAQDELHNYLTHNIRQVVRDEVLDKKKSKGKMYARPRIFDDLLSSQPLCFNIEISLRLSGDSKDSLSRTKGLPSCSKPSSIGSRIEASTQIRSQGSWSAPEPIKVRVSP